MEVQRYTTNFEPTSEELQLLVAIRNLRKYDVLELKLNESGNKIVATMKNTQRQEYTVCLQK